MKDQDPQPAAETPEHEQPPTQDQATDEQVAADEPPAAPADSANRATVKPQVKPGEAIGPLMGRWQKVLIIAYSLVLLVVATGAFVSLQGSEAPAAAAQAAVRLSLLVVLVGAIGGTVHNLASISIHAGRGDLGASWLTFYFCRPFIGAGVAMITFLVLISAVTGLSISGDNREQTLLAWSALAGLSAQPALDWLSEVLKVLFRSTDKR